MFKQSLGTRPYETVLGSNNQASHTSILKRPGYKITVYGAIVFFELPLNIKRVLTRNFMRPPLLREMRANMLYMFEPADALDLSKEGKCSENI
ncbi:MAG: hypothetical protein JWO32_200 [Bacteroidetes bacterium]|nr:hypothetical protein [Bacteroidota bacterium]